jgi:hypothetical protein
MIDIAQRKRGDRWFLVFEESDIAADEIAELETEISMTTAKPTGIIKVWMKNGAFKPRTPVKPEYVDCLCGRPADPKQHSDKCSLNAALEADALTPADAASVIAERDRLREAMEVFAGLKSDSTWDWDNEAEVYGGPTTRKWFVWRDHGIPEPDTFARQALATPQGERE